MNAGIATRPEEVADILLGRARKPSSAPPYKEAAVNEILDVDREYRMRAGWDELPEIAPRGLNPKHEAWLPILRTTSGDRHYTALFSNTAHANQSNKRHN